MKIRTAVLQGDGVKEDLLVCPEEEDPVVALARMIYVPMSATMIAAGEQRVVEDIIYLAPTDLILHALEYDRKLIKRKRPDEAQFLRLKSHGARRGEGLSWYIKASSVSLYVELLRNQPI